MTLTILSLEDEADVRDALERDLEHFWDKIRLEVAEDVDDAWAVIDEIVEDGDELALVLSDHRLPGKSGVDFLVELMKDERFGATRTVLVTGQADQSDTIRAVNQAGLDYYIGKPWNPDELRAVVRDQLTEYVLESGVNPLPYVSVLDGPHVSGGASQVVGSHAHRGRDCQLSGVPVARRGTTSVAGNVARTEGRVVPSPRSIVRVRYWTSVSWSKHLFFFGDNSLIPRISASSGSFTCRSVRLKSRPWCAQILRRILRFSSHELTCGRVKCRESAMLSWQ